MCGLWRKAENARFNGKELTSSSEGAYIQLWEYTSDPKW